MLPQPQVIVSVIFVLSSFIVKVTLVCAVEPQFGHLIIFFSSLSLGVIIIAHRKRFVKGFGKSFYCKSCTNFILIFCVLCLLTNSLRRDPHRSVKKKERGNPLSISSSQNSNKYLSEMFFLLFRLQKYF